MKQKTDSSQLVTKGFLEMKLDAMRQEIDENAREYRDEILTKLDGVMGELKIIREETSIGAHQVFEIEEETGDSERSRTMGKEEELKV